MSGCAINRGRLNQCELVNNPNVLSGFECNKGDTCMKAIL